MEMAAGREIRRVGHQTFDNLAGCYDYYYLCSNHFINEWNYMRIAMKEKENMEPIYTITGTVVHGRGIGKHVGTPTANIEVDEHATLPETGVYVAKILLDSQTYYGVTHVGMRPTLDNDKAVSIETHIFDFDNDIYGRTITIYLYKK